MRKRTWTSVKMWWGVGRVPSPYMFRRPWSALAQICAQDHYGQNVEISSKRLRKYYLESFTMSKTDRHLLLKKVFQRILVIPKNWHFNSCFVVKTSLFSILRCFDELFDIINDDPFKRNHLYTQGYWIQQLNSNLKRNQTTHRRTYFFCTTQQ